MKKFIIKIFLFFIVTIAVIISFYSYCYYKKQDEVVKIPKKNIIIGDSNTRWSMNDSTISKYSNYSVGGETYLFALTKLKILDRNNEIDTLLLSFNPHNIINNSWWEDGDGNPIDNRMSSFYQNFSQEDHINLLKTIPKNYLKSLMKIGKHETMNLFSRKSNKVDMFRFGSYKPVKENETTHKSYFEYKKPTATEIELVYLKKIIEECKGKNIKLILIQPPKNYLQKDYKNYDHPEFYSIYKKEFSDIDFLDFSKLQLPKHAYWDVKHVDIVGAEYFSNFIQNKGIRNLLNSNYNPKNMN